MSHIQTITPDEIRREVIKPVLRTLWLLSPVVGFLIVGDVGIDIAVGTLAVTALTYHILRV